MTLFKKVFYGLGPYQFGAKNGGFGHFCLKKQKLLFRASIEA